MAKRRATEVPPWIKEALPDAPGSNKRMTALAAAELMDGRWAVATATTLLVVSVDGVDVDFDWEVVDHASWDNEADTITVYWVHSSEPLRLHLVSDPEARFATTLRERVQASVVMSEVVDVAPGVSAKVALRRTATGRIISQVMGQANLDLKNPQILQRVNEAEARLREHAGLPN
ncbi:MAG TPA: hypothetical protein VK030_02095 [Actinomycetales bacterium]|nr:hypothetical protein [Actinomycetales bacterium]